MDVLSIAEEIQKKINEIEEIRKAIKVRGMAKAAAISDYEKSITLALFDLKNGVEIELEGRKIKNPPASIMDKLVRGICWQAKLAMEEAEAAYKSAVTNLDAVCAQLNAYQSLNRYLDRA